MSDSDTNTITREDARAQFTAVGQDYELEEVEVNGYTCRAFKNAPPTLRDLFEQTRSDLPFFVYGDETYTFDEIYIQSCKIARVLQDVYGIGKGDRVAISMRNYPEWVTAFCAITSIGGIAVAMNSLWLADEHEYGLRDSGARLLFADQERVDRVQGVYRDLGVQVIAVRTSGALPEDIPPLSALISDRDETTMPEAAIQPNDDATILYTSGSTGFPKGAVSCHRNVISALLSWELDLQIGMLVNNWQPPDEPLPQPAVLLSVPLFHVSGLHAVLLASYRRQGKVVSMYKWDVDQAAELIEREHVTSFTAPAAMTGDLVQAAKRTSRDLSSLMSVGGGGAARAPEQVKDIAASFENAMPGTGWGMTETNAIGTGIGGENYLQRPGSSGIPSSVLDIAIFDEENTSLPAGARGEVRVRGTSVIRGYWNRPDATAAAFTDEWLQTGDVGYLDEEGYLYIVDRIKDLVIRGGENIGCGEVEAALLEHPRVIEATVYGVPDERLGEELGCTIFCDQEIDVEELREFLSHRIARFKIPRFIQFSSARLPRIASGKINKRAIKEDAISSGLSHALVQEIHRVVTLIKQRSRPIAERWLL